MDERHKLLNTREKGDLDTACAVLVYDRWAVHLVVRHQGKSYNDNKWFMFLWCEGKLRDARSCHCSMCRKAFSAQASAYALVKLDEFSWVSGEHLLTSYESNSGASLQFCSICGSTLCGTYKGKINGVTLGCVEDDPEIELGMHTFVASKASWETIPEGVPQYEEWPPKMANE